MIGIINIVVNVGMAHVLCGAVVLSVIFGALPAFVVNKLLQKIRYNKERTLTEDQVDSLQRELEAARRRNDNLNKIIYDRINKECGKFLTTEKFDKEMRHIQDLLDLAEEADVKIQEAENKAEAIGLENQKLQRKVLHDEEALAEHQREILELNDMNMEQKKELCENKHQIQELKDFNVAMEERLFENEKEIEEMKRQNSLKDEKLEDYRKIIDELQKGRAGNDKRTKTQELEIQTALREENLQEYQQEIEDHLKELEKRQQDIDELLCGDLMNEEELTKRDLKIEQIMKEVKQQEVCHLEVAGARFQEMMDAFANQISEQEMEVICLRQEVQQKNNLLEECTAQWDSLNKKLERVQEENNHLKQLATEAEERHRTAERLELFIEYQKNEKLVTDKQKEVDELTKQLEELVQCQKEVEVLKNELEENQLTLDELVSQNQRKETVAVALQMETEELRQRLEERDREVDRLLHYAKEAEDLVKEKQIALEELQKRNQDIEDELNNTDLKIEEIMKEVEQEQARLLQIKGARFKEMIVDLRNKICDQEMEVECLRQEVQQKNQELERVNEENNHLKQLATDTEELGQKLEERDREVDRLVRCAKEAEDLQKEKQIALEELQKRNQDIEDELKKRDLEIEEIVKEVEQQQVCHLEIMTARFQEMVDAFTNQISEQEMEVICLRQEVQEKNNLLEECKAHLDRLNKALES